MEIATNELYNQNQIKNWIEQGLDNEAILANFQKMGFDESQLKELHILVKKIRNKKRTQTGSVLVLIGVIILGLGFISCIVLHYLGSDINFSLYGLTGIGAVALIIGLILIFS
jgi:hypothetical protein